MTVTFGNEVYNNSDFKNYINWHYYPLPNMRDSVKILKASPDIDIQTMEYGEYQPILAPLHKWPDNRGKVWYKSVSLARHSLKMQASDIGTKWDKLNDAVRKCFNSEPPIPMVIDVRQKEEGKPGAADHDIELIWEYAQDDPDHLKDPVLLRFTMVCPFGH